jgi:hypothetical protein
MNRLHQIFSTMRTKKIFLSLIFSLAAVAPVHAADTGGTTKAVIKAIEARDCVAAVLELNLALAGASPEALLLGGAMFEQGLCLKQNTERASRLYLRASDAGSLGARSRLAALYAAPAAGPDKGAAVWWGLQAGLPLPKPCLVDKDVRGNADNFAKILNGWPSGLLDACVHVTGVLAVLDAEFVLKAATDAHDGVEINFRPATGTLDVKAKPLNQAFVDNSPRVVTSINLTGGIISPQSATPDQLHAQQAQAQQVELINRVETVGRDAIARFPRPASVDGEWRIQLRVDGLRTR